MGSKVSGERLNRILSEPMSYVRKLGKKETHVGFGKRQPSVPVRLPSLEYVHRDPKGIEDL